MTTETLPRSAPATKPAPRERTTPIRPSEAIRLGLLEYPVAARVNFYNEETGGVCALGAMAVGYGWDPTDPDDLWIERLKGRLPAHLPAPCGHFRAGAQESIYHLNDTHGWDRRSVADWLEGLGL